MCNFLLWQFYTFIQIIFIKCFVWAVQSKLFEKNSAVLKYVRLHSEFTPCPYISYDGQFRQLSVQLCINFTYMGCLVSSDLVQISSCLFVSRVKISSQFFLSHINIRQNQLNFLLDKFCCANLFHGLLGFNSLFWSFDHNWSENW